MIGFVLGNGKSRLQYQPYSQFKGHGLVYGCNALYQDYQPDLLVAVDTDMINEILKTRYEGDLLYIGSGTRSFFLNKTNPENKPRMKNPVIIGRGWAAGPSATWLMLEFWKDIKIINLIGFDLYGNNGKINNVYAGRTNYQPITANATAHNSWVKQLKKTFEEHPDVHFYRVGNENDVIPKEWKECSNIHFVSDWVIGHEKTL